MEMRLQQAVMMYPGNLGACSTYWRSRRCGANIFPPCMHSGFIYKSAQGSNKALKNEVSRLLKWMVFEFNIDNIIGARTLLKSGRSAVLGRILQRPIYASRATVASDENYWGSTQHLVGLHGSIPFPFIAR